MTDQPIPLFKGEAMLLSWGDTSSRGKTVTFALHPDECGDAHPFRGLGTGKTGQRFAIVAVPITDDEEISAEALDQATPHSVATGSTPAEPKQPVASVESKERRPFHTLPLPQQVALRCADEAFQDWAARSPDFPTIHGLAADQVATWVRMICCVESRAEIRPGTEAAKRWARIMADYEQATGRMAEVR